MKRRMDLNYKDSFSFAQKYKGKSMGLLLLLMVACILAASMFNSATSQPIHPECQANCGNISIPYPFGTTKDCYLNSSFRLTCNSTSQPPKLSFGSIEVTNISLSGELTIRTAMARRCYFENGTEERSLYAWAKTRIFPFSVTRNKFVAIGCDTQGFIEGSNGMSYATGCTSLCSSLGLITNYSCNGIGCCQTSVPRNLIDYNVTVSSYQNHKNVWKFNNCSFALLVEESSFNFSTAEFIDLQSKYRFPAVLDWTVGNQKCPQAEKEEGYVCGRNSKCEDSDANEGYRCKCLQGFEGNPYIPNGCIDVDECQNPTLNVCVQKCNNTLGSYQCSCQKGYNGDGRKDGSRCIKDDQLLVIKVAVGISVGLAFFLLTSSWLYWGLTKRRLIKLKEKFFIQNGGLLLQQKIHSGNTEGYVNTSKIFTAEELEKATNNYEESRIIGRGGYGTVYKGILPNKAVVAIKKSKMIDPTQIEQFINEVTVLTQINHRNVVRLLGCCLETEAPILVYEFISNGTLYDHIHNDNKSSKFSWEGRLRVAAETAGVLSYLHSAASMPIIHRDIKPTNILMDDLYTAKVSDFGASRLVPIDQEELSTMVQGTLGYLDPEYLLTSQLTDKSDVYSFGVVLIELMTSKKVLSFDRPEAERSLTQFFLSLLKTDRLFEIIDERIVNEKSKEQIKEVARIAKACLKVKGEERPRMKEIAIELERLLVTEKHQWFANEVNTEETEHLLSIDFETCTYGESSCNTSAGGYESMRNQVELPTWSGR